MSRFLEEEAEELSRLHQEHAAEAKLKREQQMEREKMVRSMCWQTLCCRLCCILDRSCTQSNAEVEVGLQPETEAETEAKATRCVPAASSAACTDASLDMSQRPTWLAFLSLCSCSQLMMYMGW